MDKTVAKGERLARISGVWDGDVALSLMKAAPFRISAVANLHFNPAIQATEVLCSSRARIPETVEDWTARISLTDAKERQKTMRRLTWDGAEYKLVYQWRTYQGGHIWIEEKGRRISGNGDAVTDIEGVMRNVTSSKRAEDRATYLATHDDLTDIANLASLRTSLDHAAALSKRQRNESAFLRLRLSNITDINDVYGYEIGDRVLKEFAKRLTRIVRFPDIFGRIGAADFGIVLYGSSRSDVEAIAERLFFLLENSPVKTPHGGLYGDLRISSTQMPTQASNGEEALSQTFTILSQAHSEKLVIYDESMDVATVETSQETTSEDILEALNQRRIQLAYQPIIDTKTSRLHHYECLLRLQREDGEVVSAGRFIMAAERLGLVHLLDRRALELASETLIQEPGIHLALNVSAGTVQDRKSATEYITALKALGPRAEQVTLELTETVALNDPDMAIDFSTRIRSLEFDGHRSGHD